ncbi:MAG: 50S ribosomal protein L30e [Thermoplasmata archaeon]
MSIENSLRIAVQTGKVVFGHDRAMKEVKEKKVKLLVVARHCKNRELLEKNVFDGVPVLHFEGTAIELGRVCGKKFGVSVLGIIDPGNSNIMNEKV